MNRYTIYCTIEQTRMALKLGAPIIPFKSRRTKETVINNSVIEYDEDTFTFVNSPTVEQMIGWIEDQEGIKCIDIYRNCDYWGYGVITNITTYDVTKHFSTRKEATIAAIDAALEYLKENK